MSVSVYDNKPNKLKNGWINSHFPTPAKNYKVATAFTPLGIVDCYAESKLISFRFYFAGYFYYRCIKDEKKLELPSDRSLYLKALNFAKHCTKKKK